MAYVTTHHRSSSVRLTTWTSPSATVARASRSACTAGSKTTQRFRAYVKETAWIVCSVGCRSTSPRSACGSSARSVRALVWISRANNAALSRPAVVFKLVCFFAFTNPRQATREHIFLGNLIPELPLVAVTHINILAPIGPHLQGKTQLEILVKHHTGEALMF